jgi:glutathione S-transferase
MILYALPISNYCSKVAIVLRHKQILHQILPPPSGYGSTEYQRIVPTGKIPGLVDDQLVLSESEAINEYLEERCLNPIMLPGDAKKRAQIRQLSRHHDLAVEPIIRSLFRHVTPQNRNAEVLQTKAADLQRQLKILAKLANPQPFLLTPEMSLADVGYAPTLLLGEMMWECLGMSWSLPPQLREWQQTLQEVPAVEETLREARKVTATWIASKQG